tara:strand:+ start:174 stop:506 length:333 start_codon:yes stop_codon:yes gene_type:complete
MPTTQDPRLAALQQQAEETARFLKHIANDRRLLILCRLVAGEATVTELCAVADLSPSAVSQHLAKLRAEGVVDGRKQGLQVYYRISDPRCLGLLGYLKDEFCTVAQELDG